MINGRTGQRLRLLQWADDWIQAHDENGRPVVCSPQDVQFEPHDRRHLIASYRRYLALGDVSAGSFWRRWRLDDDGRFHERRTQ